MATASELISVCSSSDLPAPGRAADQEVRTVLTQVDGERALGRHPDRRAGRRGRRRATIARAGAARSLDLPVDRSSRPCAGRSWSTASGVASRSGASARAYRSAQLPLTASGTRSRGGWPGCSRVASGCRSQPRRSSTTAAHSIGSSARASSRQMKWMPYDGPWSSRSAVPATDAEPSSAVQHHDDRWPGPAAVAARRGRRPPRRPAGGGAPPGAGGPGRRSAGHPTSAWAVAGWSGRQWGRRVAQCQSAGRGVVRGQDDQAYVAGRVPAAELSHERPEPGRPPVQADRRPRARRPRAGRSTPGRRPRSVGRLGSSRPTMRTSAGCSARPIRTARTSVVTERALPEPGQALLDQPPAAQRRSGRAARAALALGGERCRQPGSARGQLASPIAPGPAGRRDDRRVARPRSCRASSPGSSGRTAGSWASAAPRPSARRAAAAPAWRARESGRAPGRLGDRGTATSTAPTGGRTRGRRLTKRWP